MSNDVREDTSDRRRSERTSLREERLHAQLRLACGLDVDGRVLDLSPEGMRIQVDEPSAEDTLRRARVVSVTVSTSKQVIFQAEASVVHVSALATGGVIAGLNLAEVSTDVPRNLSNRRAYERLECELPGTLFDASDAAAAAVPVVVTDISETGCRLSGIPPTNHPRMGALLELSIQPPTGTAVRVAARVVSSHSDRDCGMRFVGVMDRELSVMVAALRYPDLVTAGPEHAPGMWDVLSAAGYLRERERDRYLALREGAVNCWSRLSAPEAASLNRSVISTDAHGDAKSITQVTRFYPSAWLGHHLAAAGDSMFRRRVVPQHHGNVHDTVEGIGAGYFLVYYNALHKGQTDIYTTLRARFPDQEMALNDFACFDVTVDETAAPAAVSEVRVEQVSTAYSEPLVRWLRTVRDAVSFRALAIDRDFELAGLQRDYASLGLLRRRTWFATRAPDGQVLAAASVDVAPPGFNLTSIGNHATLYVASGFEPEPLAARRIRALLHYAGEAFRQHGRMEFLLMAPPALEETLRDFGFKLMAPGQEFVVGAGMFRTLNTFINELYRRRQREGEASRRVADA